MKYETRKINYGVKLTFEDGTVVNWYSGSKRKTVYPEKNPHRYRFPPSASAVDEILEAMRGGPRPMALDEAGRPLGAFDGGADPNPGPGAWAAVLPDGTEISGTEERTTNNRMELTGAIKLLEATEGQIHVLGDSRYVIEGITRWIHRWHERNWKTISGSPVENRDLWEKLEAVSKGRRVIWERISGHSGHPLNERCHALVESARKKLKRRLQRSSSASGGGQS